MKIGVDLRSLQVGHEFRGIGTYVRSVLNSLSRLEAARKHEFVFYFYDSTDPILLLDLASDFTFKTVVLKNPKNPENSKPKKAFAFAREIQKNNLSLSPVKGIAGLDIFVQFDQALGVPSSPLIKKVVVAHDLIPLIFRPYFLPSPIKALRRENWKVMVKTFAFNSRYLFGVKSLKRADHIVAVSKHTKHTIQELLHISGDKISVVHEGGVHNAWNTPVDTKAQVAGKKQPAIDNKAVIDELVEESQDVPYLFFIGGVEPPRRRIDDLVAAFYHLRAAGYNFRLVLGGKELANRKDIPNRETVELLQHLSYRDDVYCLGFVDDSDVNRLYQHAFAFVFPSLYEGFGLPPLEAMAHSCPVIAYDNSSLPEIVGDAALLIKPNFDAITEAVLNLYEHPEKRQKLIEAGVEQAKKFSWDKTARELLYICENLKKH